jgi:3-methyladenine DNA glycosylase/8-oxoguanine DNA glycosylase
MLLDEAAGTMEVTLPLPRRRPRTVVIGPGSPGHARVEARGRSPGRREADEITAAVRHVLHLDLDLSGFYALVAEDPDLAWAARGAGRMIRSPTVFEDVVKTVCTTNASWGLTTRMVTALVAQLGEPAPTAPAEGWAGRAFPTAEAMARRDERFYREVIRAGYRAPSLAALARSVADGSVNLEDLAEASPDDLPDDEVEVRLLALPGVGPYAAAHVMLTLGRYSRLILDSWTRPTYARLRRSRRVVSDAGILRRFRRYGPWAGLAFWLYLTRDWVPE